MGKTANDRLTKETVPVQVPSSGNVLRKILEREKTFLASLFVMLPTLTPQNLQPAGARTLFTMGNIAVDSNIQSHSV